METVSSQQSVRLALGLTGLLAFSLHVRTTVAAAAAVASMVKMLENAAVFSPRPLESHTELFRVTQLLELPLTFAR